MPRVSDDLDYDESDSADYDKDFMLEMLHIGVVEGGHLPSWKPGLTREEIVAAARNELVERTTPRDGGFLFPRWVVDMMREMREDHDFIAALAHHCYECGWMDGQEGFTGEIHLGFLAHPEGKDIEQLVEAYVAKYRPKETDE